MTKDEKLIDSAVQITPTETNKILEVRFSFTPKFLFKVDTDWSGEDGRSYRIDIYL